MRQLSLILLLLLIGAEPDTASILKKLSSDDFKQRQKAEQDLVRQGEAAIPLIEQLLKQSTDAESRTRLEGALRQIEDARKDGPSYITLHLKDAHPKEVLAELSRQAYAPMRTYPDNLFQHGNWPKVTIDLDRVTFWDAVRQAAPKMGLDLNAWNEGLRFMQGGGGQLNGPSVTEGPFLIVANTISHNKTIQLNAGGQKNNDFSLILSAFVEPKVTVLRCGSMVTIEEALDDNGNSMLSDGPNQGGYYGGGNGMWTLHARMKYPDKPGKKIARFRGSAVFTVQAESQLVEIPDIMNVKEGAHVVGGIALTVTGMKKKGDTYELGLKMGQDALRRQTWAEVQQSMQTQLKIMDEKGLPLDSRGFSSQGNNKEIIFTLQYALSRNPENNEPSGPPARLVWRVPTETKDRKVSFEFKDLPMP